MPTRGAIATVIALGALGCGGKIDAPVIPATGADATADVGSDAAGEVSPPDTGSEAGCAVGTTSCGGRCADLTRDVTNCGACGHDCLGATCVASMCTPTIVATNIPNPVGLTADSKRVYWSSAYVSSIDAPEGTVWSAPSGGGPTTRVASAILGAGALSVSGADLFIGSAPPSGSVIGSIVRVASSGGSVSSVATGVDFLPFPPATYFLAASPTTLFFTSLIDSGGMASPAISAIARAGGTATPIATALAGPATLSVTGNYLYWSETGSYAKMWTDGAIRRVPLGGGPIETVAANLRNVGFVVTDSVDAFWATRTDGGIGNVTIWSAPVAGGTPRVVLTGQDAAYMTGDDANLYWTTIPPDSRYVGTIVRMSKSDTAVLRLATAADYTLGIAVDAKFVYWLEISSDFKLGTVKCVAR
jgi:hypothetical protein